MILELLKTEVLNAVVATRLLELHWDEIPISIDKELLSTYVLARALSNRTSGNGILRRINESVVFLVNNSATDGEDNSRDLKYDFTRVLCEQAAFVRSRTHVVDLLAHFEDTACYPGNSCSTKDHNLAAAALMGYTECVSTTLRREAQKANPKTCFGMPICCAAKGGHYDTTKLLLNAQANEGGSAFAIWLSMSFAASAGHNDIIRLLRESLYLRLEQKSLDSTVCFLPSVLYATEEGHLDTVLLLLSLEIEKSDIQVISQVLREAAHHGRLEIVQCMLEYSANVNHTCGRILQSPLELAASRGHTEVVSFILANGANEEHRRGLAILKAAECGFKQVVQVLIDCDTDAGGDERLQKALITAARYGQADMLEFLLSKIDIKRYPEVGIEAMHYANKNNFFGIVNMLIEHGVVIHQRPWMAWGVETTSACV